jgi:hypothetical protein
MKKLVAIAKEQGKILPVSEAFRMFPAEYELRVSVGTAKDFCKIIR